jgi:flagellar motor switch protein FliM
MTDASDPATSSASGGAIARIVAAHRRGAVAARDRAPALTRAWGRALRHAAVPFRGLDLAPEEVAAREGAPLSQAIEALPEHGLVIAIEDREGRRGMLALSHDALDALIEVQTTGKVEAKGLSPRPVTRIDEALSRDFIDLALAAFTREAEAVADRDWPERMTYGSLIADRRQLNLLLPDHAYHVLTASFRLGTVGERRAEAMLAVPRTGRGGQAVAETPRQPEAWREGLDTALRQAELRLDAVLLRVHRPLREVETLAPGDLIHFDPGDLASVSLETPAGRRVATGRLGQVGGLRALRIADPDGQGQAVGQALGQARGQALGQSRGQSLGQGPVQPAPGPVSGAVPTGGRSAPDLPGMDWPPSGGVPSAGPGGLGMSMAQALPDIYGGAPEPWEPPVPAPLPPLGSLPDLPGA